MTIYIIVTDKLHTFRHSVSKKKYSEDDIIKMLEFLVGNIFVVLPEKSSSR